MTARFYSFAAAVGLAGAVFLWLALQLPGGEAVTTLIGPRTWPLLIVVAMLALVALFVILLALRGPAQFAGADDDHMSAEEIAADAAVIREDAGGSGWRHLAVLAVTVAYTVAMDVTGYLLATAVFAAIVNVILGERRPLRIAICTVAAVLIVAVVFDHLLNIPLP
ncbi:MAG: tripartite tricarboxylate transporter TctB family protein [Rhodobacteraceae bacterium]|nr:MAG: tripartite tricarboxylate transporter TctB family protein [Paracoccaceae bacterium]